MGFFDFIKDAGAKLLGHGDDNASVKKEIKSSLPIENLDVNVTDDTVTLSGEAASAEERAKAALIAGNVEGITKVVFDDLKTKDNSELEENYYTIQKGDTLWKIATDAYGNGSKYTKIVEANLEVIKDANKIYPGQKIRIPNLD